MILINAIKRAAAALQMAVTPHDIPTVPVENEIGKIIPAEPSAERQAAEQKIEAARIIKELQSQRRHTNQISQEDRRNVMEQLRRAGPPRDALVWTGSGYRDLNGNVIAARGRPVTQQTREAVTMSEGLIERKVAHGGEHPLDET